MDFGSLFQVESLIVFGITWIISFNQPLFTVFDHSFSGRDLILLTGGLFLLFKSTMEIHHKMEGLAAGENGSSSVQATLMAVIG